MGSPNAAMDYASVKLLHESAVALTGLGFVVRGVASFRGMHWTRGRLVRMLPHLVDTVLLASAVVLAALLHLNPMHTPWLLAKICGLLLYIALGVVAMRPRFGLKIRRITWALALVVLAWIVSVAILTDPWGFIALV